MGLLVVQGLLPVATVYLTRYVVDGVVEAMGSGGTWEAVVRVAWPAGLMGGTLLLAEVVGAALVWVRQYHTEFIEDRIRNLIHDTSTTVDLAFYETPEYYDHLHRARSEAWHRPQKLVENAGSLVQSGITLIAMGAVLLRFSAWVPAVLLVSTVPALFVVLRHALKQYRWRLENTADERRTWYYDHELTSGETAAELRLFSLGDYFKKRYRTVRKRLRSERLKLSRDQSLAELGASVFALLATAGCLAWMGLRALNGLLTLGELALFYVAFRQGQQMMRALLGNVGDIYRNILFLGDLFEFLGLEPTAVEPDRPVAPPQSLTNGIDFSDVTFNYPGSERPVIDDFALSIPAGKITAIVGPNGSGKSTLLKLICRLYDPQAGRISFDGVDLKSLRIEDVRRLITVLFQQPVQYSVTAAENINFGDIGSKDGRRRIEQAATAAGADDVIRKLPDEYETILGKWFEGGAELSVGEWQRVALARAFLRRAPIILLDEPTSAMDSWAEADWMKRLHDLAREQTVVIITHRFTTAMRTDVIYVMDEGRIVESGSHEDLLARGGIYADSWQEQMRDA
ncbi:MAG: ABC transporter ATP-binding protein [Deltaproteobacteria bacterium]|nr:ABC transporter ATP-binding protein [Deltaproteobacteria bacterium]